MDTGISTHRIDFGVCVALNSVTAIFVPCGTFFVCKTTFLCHRNLLPPVTLIKRPLHLKYDGYPTIG